MRTMQHSSHRIHATYVSVEIFKFEPTGTDYGLLFQREFQTLFLQFGSIVQ